MNAYNKTAFTWAVGIANVCVIFITFLLLAMLPRKLDLVLWIFLILFLFICANAFIIACQIGGVFRIKPRNGHCLCGYPINKNNMDRTDTQKCPECGREQ